MLALTVSQPYATLIVLGIKTWEFRTWQPKEPPGRILIHAASYFHDHADRIVKETAVYLKLRQAGFRGLGDLPRSCILGSVQVGRVLRRAAVANRLTELDRLLMPPTWDFAWELTHPVREPTPTSASGRLFLWECPLEVKP
jgi:hypothetical protein